MLVAVICAPAVGRDGNTLRVERIRDELPVVGIRRHKAIQNLVLIGSPYRFKAEVIRLRLGIVRLQIERPHPASREESRERHDHLGRQVRSTLGVLVPWPLVQIPVAVLVKVVLCRLDMGHKHGSDIEDTGCVHNTVTGGHAFVEAAVDLHLVWWSWSTVHCQVGEEFLQGGRRLIGRWLL
jgi:hypothetical protein